MCSANCLNKEWVRILEKFRCEIQCTVGNVLVKCAVFRPVQCCKKPPLFRIQEEKNLGLTAQFDIAEFSAIINRLCMDRHSAAPNTPNSSSLLTPTLMRFSPHS